jgi:hypothetical protein
VVPRIAREMDEADRGVHQVAQASSQIHDRSAAAAPIPAAAPRPRRELALVRTPAPRTSGRAGFGKPSSYNTKLAIALDARSAPLSADASTTASIGARQNVATIALETQDGTAVALGAVNNATISLNTSE